MNTIARVQALKQETKVAKQAILRKVREGQMAVVKQLNELDIQRANAEQQIWERRQRLERRVLVCPQCRAENEATQQYCGTCGTKL